MLEQQRKRHTYEVALASTVSWLPLVLGRSHPIAYAAFAVLFIARYVSQPRDDTPPTPRRRLLLIGLGWSALACLAWSWLPLFLSATRLGPGKGA
jgi:hypothetical protein